MKKFGLISLASFALLLSGCGSTSSTYEPTISTPSVSIAEKVNVSFFVDATMTDEEYVHVDAQVGDYLSEPSLPEAPSLATPYFVGWSTKLFISSNVDLWNFSSDTVPNAKELHLYGQWDKAPVNNVTVNFYKTSSDETPLQTITTKTGEKIVKIADPSIEGKNFLGWSTQKVSSTYWDFDVDEIPENITSLSFYGQWEDLPAGYKRIYFQDAKWWNDGMHNTSIYLWNDASVAKAEWPGEAMTHVKYDELDGYNIFYFDFDSNEYTNVIFNNGTGDFANKSQTIDLSVATIFASGNCYSINGTSQAGTITGSITTYPFN